MEYRIVIETEKSGKEHFYIQRKRFYFFWVYASQVKDISMTRYRIVFNSFEEAKNFIELDKEIRFKNDQKKIVKVEKVDVEV